MWYAILLLVLGILLAFMEVFVPSGGILGLLAAGAIIGALVLVFQESTAMGFAFAAAVTVLVPTMIVLGLKVFPKTPIGRRLILQDFVETPEQRGSAGVSNEDYSRLLGKTGQTVTPLRPSGTAEIEGERYSVVARGEMIERDTTVVVVEIEGNSMVVERKEG